MLGKVLDWVRTPRDRVEHNNLAFWRRIRGACWDVMDSGPVQMRWLRQADYSDHRLAYEHGYLYNRGDNQLRLTPPGLRQAELEDRERKRAGI